MKIILFFALIIGSIVIFLNLQFAKSIESQNQDFILSKESEIQDQLKADLLTRSVPKDKANPIQKKVETRKRPVSDNKATTSPDLKLIKAIPDGTNIV
ncbi:MAG TPA: hypothetical protein PLQ36_00530, partial [Candidatus Gracilibacteria bacterium]|nr:hypothetical protein [Candidatus Gracilibacteria bacterium]